jgi:hypothetical protein
MLHSWLKRSLGPGSGSFADCEDPGRTLERRKADPSSELFRNIFFSLLRPHYEPQDIHRLIFALDPKFQVEAEIQGSAPFEERSEAYASVTPFDLYSRGIRTPFESVDDVDRALRVYPITLVILPGICGEFIDHSPFHEVLGYTESRFAKIWKETLRQTPTLDQAFDLDPMKAVDIDFDKLIQAASIDDETGQDLVRVLYLRPLFGSLETLGTLQGSSTVYLRRLNKIHNLLGDLKNCYLMGYSRGLNVALQCLHDASQDADVHPWFKDIKGVVSLGGTLYGSPLADAIFAKGTLASQAFDRMNRLSEDLVTTRLNADLSDKIKAAAVNAAAWSSAMADLLAIGVKLETPEGLKMEDISTDGLNLGAFGRLLSRVMFDKFKVDEGSEFNHNVERFRILMRELTECARSVTREAAIEWQRTHTLPSNLNYYVLQGTMGDPSDEISGPSPLASDSVSFNTKTIDYAALRRSYYEYFKSTGIRLNDSQTSPDRSLFWPAFHRWLNPNQGEYRSQLLAVLGVDHWGMSFPVALESQNGEVSPFPRSILLHAVGAFLAQDLMERS